MSFRDSSGHDASGHDALAHDALALYLRQAAGVPFELGINDCGMFVGDWVLQCTGIDPCAELRGTYRTPEEKQQLLELTRLGKIMRVCAETCGFAETENPRRGDVGSFMFGTKLAIGIFTGTAWAGKNERGIFVSRNPICLKAYKVMHV